MAGYLDSIGAGLILLDADPLDYDFIPEELVGRETIQRQLASRFSQLAHPEGSGKAIVTGPVGSGKTSLVKVFCRDITRHLSQKRDIRNVHINCRNTTTTSQVLQKIVQHLDAGHPDRGLSSGEMLTSLRRILQREQAHLIVVLDEVDHLLRRSGNDVLYHLLRIDEDGGGKGTLSLILISQEQVLDVLEDAVVSRLQATNHLPIPAYNADELYAIAEQRARLACAPASVSEGVLRLMAEAAAPRGDARQVIELLGAGIRRAESEGRSELLASDIQATAIALPASSTGDVLGNLQPHAMLTLLAMCRRLKKSEYMTMGDVEQLYNLVCEEYEVSPRAHTTMWKYLKMMEGENIIATRVSSVEDGRGRTTHISMPHLLPADLIPQIEAMLTRKL